MRNVVIVDACRTAVGKFGGTLKPLNAEALAATVLKGVLDRTGLDPSKVDEVIMATEITSNSSTAVTRSFIWGNCF